MRFYLFLFSFVFIIFSSSCSSKKYLSNASAENLLIADSLNNDAKIDSIISPYKTKIDRAVSEKLIVSEIDLKTKKLGGNLGYFIADVLAEAVHKETYQKIDLVFLNSNALHPSEFKQGVISTGQMYEVMPHNYGLVFCQIKGKEIKKLFDKIIENNDGIISKTTSIFINKTTNYKAFGINSLPIEDELVYNIVMVENERR